ncbi:hypothetical protein GIB67_007857, partial [Kingdonia uniflora]
MGRIDKQKGCDHKLGEFSLNRAYYGTNPVYANIPFRRRFRMSEENNENLVEVTNENSNEELLIDGANDDAVNGVNIEKDKDVAEIAREENASEKSEKGTPPSLVRRSSSVCNPSVIADCVSHVYN